ncbi:hypothetical protein NC653_014097 [Populus alba x Populus x berolinensis]|uniref:Uncharacterized protein n=1 Tax=Populus alba x Populus x berolinensis TaxID=444605 RepID=A0AAD6W4E2_9ROSI|nr:hypothetical protein NC653_014097 [Populus alba x Populus x berolinensis]
MEAALSDEQRRLLQEPGELGSLAGSSNMPELNQVISHQDLAPSTLVDVPDSTRQGSPSFNSISMQDDQSPKGGDHQPQIFDGNIDLSFLENEEGNVTGEISDSSVAEAPNSQLLDFEPSSFGIPLMEHRGHLEPESSDEPYLNRANSGQSIVQSAYSTFDPLHGNFKNAEQTRSSSVTPPIPIPTQFSLVFPRINNVTDYGSRLPLVLPFNQSSISFNDQVGQNNAMNSSIQQTTQFPASYPQNMVTTHAHSNLLQRPLASIRITTTMGNLEGTPSWINQYYELFPNHNAPPGPLTPSRRQHLNYDQLRLSDQVPGMLSGPQPPMNQRHPNSFIHQPHPGHVYMNPNAATTQHGGFNQSGPSSLAPWVQFFSSQVQVNQAAVMPNIENMQQENFVPWNFGNSTRSQMDSLHVQGLLNQAARSNASNLGLDTSLNSQIMGLDHNRQGKSTEVFSHHPDMVSMLNNHSENMILGSRGRGSSHFIIGESSSSKRQRTEWTPSHKVQESMNASSLGPRVDKNAIYDPRFEGIGLQIDPHLRMLALM